MKFNKNSFQIFTLLVSVVALMMTMIVFLFQNENDVLIDSPIILILATTLVVVTGIVYSVLVIKRINPKKYIYLSYSSSDSETASIIASILEAEFLSLSKYRFEILTADSISYGDKMHDKMQENISKADIVIIIGSPAYLESRWCIEEFNSFSNLSKLIIPIVMHSFNDLHELPNDLSDIKALSLIDCSEDEISQKINSLAKDLIKKRRD